MMKGEYMKKHLTITDIKGKVHNLNLEETSVINMKNKYPHWCWWVLWLVLFWPVMFVLFFMRKKVYRIQHMGEIILVEEGTGVRILNALDKFEE